MEKGEIINPERNQTWHYGLDRKCKEDELIKDYLEIYDQFKDDF